MDNFLVPLYIGKSSTPGSSKSKARDSYYFYGSKDGVGRFIKYSNYPFWDMGSKLPDFLVLEEAPESVVNDVRAFVEGKVEFTLVPKTKGKHEKVLRKEVSYNQEYGVNNAASITSNTAQSPPSGTSGTRPTTGPDSGQSRTETTTSKVEEHRLPPSTQDRENSERKGSGSLRSDSGSPDHLVRGTNTGSASGGELPGSVRNAGSPEPTSELPGPGQQSGGGILDDSGNGERMQHVRTPVSESPRSTLDGSHSVKQKRVRRTKEELASGRSLEDIRASREG